MGIAERKERERLEMRQRIIHGAMQMFLEEGYEKTSIRNIAEKIEYSPATIYLYYKDKDELLYDVQREAFEQLITIFSKEATAEDPYKRLEQICRTYIKFGREHTEMYDLMFIIRAPMNVVDEQHLWTNGHDAFGFLVQCLSECIEQKLVRFKNVMTAALSVWAMGHGLVSLDIRCRFMVMEMTETDIQDAIEASINEYLELIKA